MKPSQIPLAEKRPRFKDFLEHVQSLLNWLDAPQDDVMNREQVRDFRSYVDTDIRDFKDTLPLRDRLEEAAWTYILDRHRQLIITRLGEFWIIGKGIRDTKIWNPVNLTWSSKGVEGVELEYFFATPEDALRYLDTHREPWADSN